jgi:predicted Zn-dependent peptidase
MLVAYQEVLFVGSNAIAVFAGRIPDIPHFFETAEHHFKNISALAPQRQSAPFVETQSSPRLKIVPSKIDQTLVELGIKHAVGNQKYHYALIMLSAILGHGMSSRLFSEIRERRGLAYDIGSSLDFQSDVVTLEISAALKQERWKEGLEVIFYEISMLAEKEVSDEEFEKTKKMIIGEREMHLEDSRAVGREIAGRWGIFDIVEDPMTLFMRNMRVVTPADVRRVAREILRDDRMCLAVMGPHEHEEDEVRRLLRISSPGAIA